MKCQTPLDEVENLRQRLEEAEETLRAIRSGEVDAIVSTGARGQQVYLLNGAEEPYRDFIETMNEGAATVLAGGAINFCNRRFAEILRRPLEQVMGASLQDFAAGGYADRLCAIFEQARAGNASGEVLLAGGDGAEMWIAMRLSPTRLAGQPGICLVAEDITERKSFEAALADRTNLMRSLIDGSTDLIFAKDRELRLVLCNHAYLQALGKPFEEIHGKTDVEAGWDPEFVRGNAARGVAGWLHDDLRAVNGETVHVHAEPCNVGTRVRLFDTVKSPLRNARGEVIGLVGISRDVTDNKRAEMELAESERRYRRLHDSMADAYCQTDLQGRLLEFNAAFEHMLGYPREELAALTLAELTPARWHAAEARIFEQQVLARGHSDIYEKEFRRRDGRVFPVESHTFAIRDESGNAVGAWAIVRDLTERKQAEAVLAAERQRFLDVLENLPAMICVLRPDYRITFANRNFRERFGESAGRPCYECRFGRSEPCETCEAFLPLRTGRPHEHELTLPDGGVIVAHSVAFADADGSPLIIQMNLDVTEMRRAQKAVEKAGAYHRSLIEASLDPMVTIAPDGKITDVNHATERATGLPRQVLIGTDFASYFTDCEKARSGYRLVYQEGKVQDYELEIRHRDGSLTPVLYNAALYRDRSGEPVGIFAAARDISARKLAEERFRTLFESMEEGFISCRMIEDEAGRPVDFQCRLVNAAFSRLIGLPADMLLGQSIRKVLPRLEPFWIETLGHVVQSGRSQRLEGPVAGLNRYLEAFAWRSGPGQFAATFTDVTEKRRSDQAIRRLSELVDLSHDAIVTLDADRVVLTWNEGAAEMYGWSEREALGRVAQELLQTRTALEFDELKKILDREGRWDGEIEQVARGGRHLFVESRQVLESAGGVVTILEINRDITARKRAEEDLRQLNAQLEQRVVERTQQLEAANKELEAFAYSVSHDLRAPLRGIDGWSLALMEDCAQLLDPRAREYLGRVRSEAQHMGLLIGALLELSRVTRSEMERQPLDLSAMARVIGQRLQSAESGRAITFTIEDEILAEGDARLLEIVLNNLLENAVKYTARCAEARIEFRQSGSPGNPVYFVRDNGVGFRMAYADKLFGAFQRLHRPSEFPGTGVGLATVQRIIRRHGGRVWAEAEENRGATFYFTLAAP